MSPSSPAPVSRRTVFAGAGTVGALAAAAAVLPGASKAPVQTAEAKLADTSGGYQLTDHVKQYYATARI